MANLISAYHFDGDSIDKVDGNDGSDTGVIYDATTKHLGSHSAAFDGDDFISLGDPVNLQPNLITFATWFNTSTSGSTKVLLRKRGNGYGIQILTGGEILGFIFGVNSDLALTTSVPTYNDGSWHRVICTFDGDVFKMFIDNILRGIFNMSSTTTVKYSGGAIAFGQDGDSPTARYIGNLDAPAFWDGVLTDGGVTIIGNPAGGEVAADWNGGAGVQYPITAGVQIFRRRMEEY
jgi:hypothetical protein